MLLIFTAWKLATILGRNLFRLVAAACPSFNKVIAKKGALKAPFAVHCQGKYYLRFTALALGKSVIEPS